MFKDKPSIVWACGNLVANTSTVFMLLGLQLLEEYGPYY